MAYCALLILPFLAVAQAANDWTKPCTTGVCSWDIPSANGSASGTVKIWGAETAIGDITGAAGWTILGCDPSALAQDIRLVCTGDKSQCEHLYSGHGAVDTLVRLPNSCGRGPFARIADAWVPEDQSLPSQVAARFARRAEPAPEVKALKLDTNFASVDITKTGTVNLAIKGANVPGVQDILAGDTASNPSRRRSRHSRRGLGSFVKNAAKSIGKTVTAAATNVAQTASKVASTATKAVSAVENTADKAASGVKKTASKAASDVKKTASKAASGVKQTAAKVETGAKKTAAKVEKSASKAASGVKKTAAKVEKGAAEAAGGVGKAASKAASTVEKGASKAVAGAKKAASKAVDGVETAAAGVKNATSAAVAGVKNAASAAADGVKKAAAGVENAASTVADGVEDAVSDAEDAVSDANNVDIDESKALRPIDFSKSATLFEKSLDCPPVSAKVSVDVDAKAHAVVTLGVVASGTIMPPQITDFAIIASLTADLDGEIQLVADLSGSIESGNIKLFEVGIPGLDFPGILSVGPTFQVNANAKATLDLNVDMKVGLNYHIDKAQLVFPPNGEGVGGAFSLGDTPLKLSADTKAAATGTVEAHLIPSLNLGISALSVVKASVFLNLDASAKATLKVEASAGASVTAKQAKRQDDVDFDRDSAERSAAAVAALSGISSRAAAVAVAADAKASFGGSFVVSAGLNVNAGATGTFFKIFDATTKVSLFQKTFTLLTKNFGANTKRGESSYASQEISPVRRLTLETRALSCLTKSSAPTSLVDQSVAGKAL